MGLVPCHIGLYFGKVPAVEALSHGEGRRGLPGRASSHRPGAFLRPVSLLRCGGISLADKHTPHLLCMTDGVLFMG